MHGSNRERGVVLVITLIMLLLLTIIGLSSMTMATLQERMASNSHDRNYALQAAEATLRHAELRIAQEFHPAMFAALGSTSRCGPGGLCLSNDFLTDHPWKNVDWSDSSRYKAYGGFTDQAADSAYVIEYMPLPGCPRAKPVGDGWEAPPAYDKYRITANASGRSTTANVQLQSLFQKRFGTCG